LVPGAIFVAKINKWAYIGYLAKLLPVIQKPGMRLKYMSADVQCPMTLPFPVAHQDGAGLDASGL
jgi:hypothetical protein